MIIDGKEVYPTSSESMSMPCPKCGTEGRRYVWVNTVVRGVQIKEVCYTCDYEKFEPWEVVEESYSPSLTRKPTSHTGADASPKTNAPRSFPQRRCLDEIPYQ